MILHEKLSRNAPGAGRWRGKGFIRFHLWACCGRRKGGDYDFVRIHKTLKVTPARAAGVTNRLWDMINMVSVPEA
jgi:hypothetical protein